MVSVWESSPHYKEKNKTLYLADQPMSQKNDKHPQSPWLLSYLAVQTVHPRSSACISYKTTSRTSAPLWKKWLGALMALFALQ